MTALAAHTPPRDALASWEEAVRWLLSQPDLQQLAHACYYDQPAERAARRFHASHEWSATRALLPSRRGRIVDVGAGNGIASYALACDGWDVTAVEPDPSALVGAGAIRALAATTGVRIDVAHGCGEQLPVASGEAAAVYERQMFHHAADPGAFCAEVFRALEPGGVFIAAREHVVSSPRQLPRFLAQHPLHRLYGGENAYTRTQYLSFLTRAGFRVERTLGPFASAINYAPHGRADLRREIVAHVPGAPLRSLSTWLLDHEPALDLALRLLNRVDRRPGRLFTFVARKPRSG